MTLATQEEKLATQVSKLDERLIDLSRREQALAEATEASPATGAPLALAETLLALCSLATNPSGNTPKLPGVEIQSARTNHLTGRIPSMSLALQSDTVFGSEISTVETGDIQPMGRSARRLLSLCRQSAPKYGQQSYPVLTSSPAAAMVAEGSVLADSAVTFTNPPPLATPHQAQVRANFTLQSLLQSGGQFQQMVDDSLATAQASLMATQLVTGSGVSPALTGLLNTTGVGESLYTATNRGAASSFRSAEGLLDDVVYGPEGRLAFVVGNSLYRKARETLREPGTGQYVIEDGQVLGEIEAVKNGDLGDDQAILFDASYVVLCVWDQSDIVIDMVSKPGNVLTTITSWIDVVPLRPASIVVMDQA